MATPGEDASAAAEGQIEVGFQQAAKAGQPVAGDVFVSRRLAGEDRVVSVLSDGLGSGVKASVLATLTATMGLRYASAFRDVRRSAEAIMGTLPVCSVRGISYSTFTIVDVDGEGDARVIEHGNPPFLLVRDGRVEPLPSERIGLDRWPDRPLALSRFQLRLGDRLVFFSDGVSQAGMGRPATPLGWGQEAVAAFVAAAVRADPEVSARRLAGAVVDRAVRCDGEGARDDVSCAILCFRRPRRLLVVTGPPFDEDRDPQLARQLDAYPGRRAVCGGTTAAILARELGRPLAADLTRLDGPLPPAARMEGVDLVTEGTLTLARAADLLEAGAPLPLPADPAGDLVELLLDSDVIDFVVGTRVNEAHQDPSLPVELALRRTLVKRLRALLEERFARETSLALI